MNEMPSRLTTSCLSSFRSIGSSSMLILTFLLYSVSLPSCYYDVEAELYPETTCQTLNLSYSQDIVPILQNNCYRCHDQQNQLGGVLLEGHTPLLKFVNNGKLLGVIRWDTGFPTMPRDAAKIPDCNISMIETWVNDGAPNN